MIKSHVSTTHFINKILQYLGSQDIEDYRNKRETSAIMADLKRRSSKAPKPKALISLFAKELIVMDEKSKVQFVNYWLEVGRIYTCTCTNWCMYVWGSTSGYIGNFCASSPHSHCVIWPGVVQWSTHFSMRCMYMYMYMYTCMHMVCGYTASKSCYWQVVPWKQTSWLHLIDSLSYILRTHVHVCIRPHPPTRVAWE